MIDLPAPVSPESTLNPGASGSDSDSMMAKLPDAQFEQHTGYGSRWGSPPHPSFWRSVLKKLTARKAHDADAVRRAPHGERFAEGERGARLPVHGDQQLLGRVLGLHAHHPVGGEHQRPDGQRVGRYRRDEQRVERGKEDRTAGRQRVRRGTGGRADHHAVGGVAGDGLLVGRHAQRDDAGEAALVEDHVVEGEPVLPRFAGGIEDEGVERDARLHGVVAVGEAGERRLELIGLRDGEEAQPAQVHAEDRHLAGLEQARAAEQRAVAAQGEQGIERRRIVERRARRALLEQIRFGEQFQAQARRDLAQRAQHLAEAGIDVAAMPDHAQARHPAIASVSCIARTRSAIPSGVRPHSASCRARGRRVDDPVGHAERRPRGPRGRAAR